jgi:hypothetical protein
MEHFVKLWSSILDSSVWRQPIHIKVVWVTMLAMAERDGYVGASILGIADRAGVTREQAKEAIQCFLSPDEDSRTKTNDGRRLVEVERGWHILNFQAHRERRDEEQKRIADRERQRKSRQSRSVTPSHTSSPPSPVVAHAEAEADGEGDREVHQITPPPPKGAKTAAVKPDDVTGQTWSDWVAHRKAKRATVTETVVRGMRKEADKAGITLDEAMRYSCTMGWQGFQADWLKTKGRMGVGVPESRKMDYTPGTDESNGWEAAK